MLFLKLVAVIVAGVSVYLQCGVEKLDSKIDIRNVIDVISSVDATLLGFLISAGALLYAVANTKLLRNLQRTGHFDHVLSSLFLDASLFLIALVIAMICLFIPALPIGTSSFTWLNIGISALVFFNVLAFVLIIPVGWYLWILLSNLKPDDSTLEG